MVSQTKRHFQHSLYSINSQRVLNHYKQWKRNSTTWVIRQKYSPKDGLWEHRLEQCEIEWRHVSSTPRVFEVDKSNEELQPVEQTIQKQRRTAVIREWLNPTALFIRATDRDELRCHCLKPHTLIVRYPIHIHEAPTIDARHQQRTLCLRDGTLTSQRHTSLYENRSSDIFCVLSRNPADQYLYLACPIFLS